MAPLTDELILIVVLSALAGIFLYAVYDVIRLTMTLYRQVTCDHHFNVVFSKKYVDTSGGARHDQVTFRNRHHGRCERCDRSVNWTTFLSRSSGPTYPHAGKDQKAGRVVAPSAERKGSPLQRGGDQTN